MAVQYCCGIMMLATLPAAMGDSMRAMIITQGLRVSDAGRGQLNAAYSGLGQITAVFSALWWGGLYRYFSSQGPDTHLLLRWGAGGHFLVTSMMMLGSWAAMAYADPRTLYIQDDESGDGDSDREAKPKKYSM